MRIEIFTKSKEIPELIDGPVLHSRTMFRTIEESRMGKPYMLVAFDEEGAEIGHILIVKRRSIRIIPPVFSVWYSILGEGAYSKECTDREKVFALFLEKVFDMFDFHHSFIEVMNFEDSRFAYATLHNHGFVPIRDYRNYISLHSRKPQERLSRAYKAHIRKAEAAGVTLRRATGDDEINEALIMMRNFYRSKTRKRLPSTECLYRMLHNDDGTLSDNARMFLVIYKDRTIGCSISLYEKGRALLAYSCGLRKSHPLLYPGIMSVWAAIEDAHRRGIPHFEFAVSGAPLRNNTGFRNFILNFGGKQVSTIRWYRYRWMWINKILRKIYV
jgi:hypothetical protein